MRDVMVLQMWELKDDKMLETPRYQYEEF